MFTYETDRFRDEEMQLASHFYRGRSIGSEETCHQFPGYDLCFDMGAAVASSTPISNVFITHGHEDHCAGFPRHHKRREAWGLKPATYHVPNWDLEQYRTMLRARADLTRSKAPLANIVPVAEGDRFKVNENLTLHAFHSYHRIPCLGYVIYSHRKRLKKEFVGKNQEELTLIKKAGTELSEAFDFPEIAFPGDTSYKTLVKNEFLGKTRLLLLECTFVDDTVTPAEAARTGHIHIKDIISLARDGYFENQVLLLTHFSARYTSKQVYTCLSKELADTNLLDKVVLLLPERYRYITKK